MSQQYSAFISYRHHPLDSAVAADIQRRLERFHIPGAIRRLTGIKRLPRLFRDRSELAITSDINEDILQALDSAEHLIVICSSHTAESVWVQREIEHFLRSHDHSRILTVLAEGEPQDVIPDILCHARRAVTDENGLPQMVELPVEPLSCDFRGYTTDRRARRTALREELPRLAAALLGCPYDALRQRQRQYRMRRLAAFFTAALVGMAALAGYFLWSGLRIQENYQQSLRSQSMYLAEESLRLAQDGDRLTALYLALAALPDEELDRPLVARAEYALGVATAAYTVPGTGGISAVCSFDHSSTVQEFFLSKDSTRLFVRDASGTTTVWDTNTYKQLQTRTWQLKPQRMLSVQDDRLLILLFDAGVACYDWENDCIPWSISTEEWSAGYMTDSLAISPDGLSLLATYRYADDDYVTRSEFHRIDIASGQVLERWPIPTDSLPEDASQFAYDHTYAPDGSAAAFTVSVPSENYSYRYLPAVFDFTTGQLTVSAASYAYIHAMSFAADGSLLVMVNRNEMDESLYMAGYTLLKEADNELLCLDRATGGEKWSAGFVSTQVNYYSALHPVQFPTPDGALDAVCCTMANRWVVVDTADGTQLASWTLPAPAILTLPTETGLQSVLLDGQRAAAGFGDSGVGSTRLFTDDLTHAALGRHAITHRRGSSSLVMYRNNVADTSWQPVGEGLRLGYGADSYLTGSGLLLTSTQDACLIDPAGRRVLWSTDLDGRTVVGLAPDGNALLCRKYSDEDGSDILWRLDLADGSFARQPVQTSNLRYYCAGAGMFLSYEYDEAFHGYLAAIPADGGAAVTLQLPEQAEYISDIYGLADAPWALVCDGPVTLLADLTAHTLTVLEGDAEGDITGAVWQPDLQLMAVIREHRIDIYRVDGTLQATIQLPSLTPASLCFYDDDTLLVACTDHRLYRYDTDDGAPAGSSPLSNVSSYFQQNKWSFTDDGCLVLHSGTVANIVRTDSWITSAYVPHCCGWLPDRQLFFTATRPDDTTTLGCFARHSLQELIDTGRAQLGGNVPDNDTLRAYGLVE